MIHKVNDPVSVKLICDHKRKLVYPQEILWEGHKHIIKKIGLRHSSRVGKVLYHVYSVASDTLFFRLVLDTETLFWQLEEISDGLPD